MLEIFPVKENLKAIEFCELFSNSTSISKYIFGRNKLAESIANIIEVDGFIDDFTDEEEYLNKPIVRIESIPKNALVVSAVAIARPIIAERRLKQFNINYLDYFSFCKYSRSNIEYTMFRNDFIRDLETNISKYNVMYDRLNDSKSKDIFKKIINFRVSCDLNYMREFADIQDRQYFEDFLNLSNNEESFVDVGGFDGHTSIEFIKRCPNYKSIYFFEPEEKNINIAKNNLEKYNDVNFYQLGLSNKKGILKFDIDGPSSNVNKDGNFEIQVDLLDNIITEPVSFIKMDIEGSEVHALEGAENTIKRYHPKLAICAYHKPSDFWEIPEQIFRIRNDYSVYLRHYTEGIYETVMFFIPIQ